MSHWTEYVSDPEDMAKTIMGLAAELAVARAVVLALKAWNVAIDHCEHICDTRPDEAYTALEAALDAYDEHMEQVT